MQKPSVPRPPSSVPLLLLFAALVLTHAGCSYYSFTGATIPSHLETIAIPLVQDISASPVTDLEDDLTRLLVDRFVGQTRLSLEQTEAESDAVLFAEIQRYVNQPAAVGGEAQATLNRVTITVRATYVDQVNDQQIFERAFSASDEYSPSAEGLAGEEDAAATILENIADDIFTAATSNW